VLKINVSAWYFCALGKEKSVSTFKYPVKWYLYPSKESFIERSGGKVSITFGPRIFFQVKKVECINSRFFWCCSRCVTQRNIRFEGFTIRQKRFRERKYNTSLPRSFPGRIARNVRRRKKTERQTEEDVSSCCLVSDRDRQSYEYTTSIFPFSRYIIYPVLCPANQIVPRFRFIRGHAVA
jgi:hypothetical protein